MQERIQKLLSQIDLSNNFLRCSQEEGVVFLELRANTPAMHEKKKLEEKVKLAFAQEFGNDVSLKLKITSPESQPKNPQRGKEIESVKNIIAIASGKGGVGKSTVASNLAVSLAKMGFAVGLLDADIYGPSVPTMFGTIGQKPSSVRVGERILMQPIEQYGVKMLSIGYFSGVEKAVAWRGPMAGKALHQMIRDTHWGELDFLLIDLPPGTGDIHLSLVQELPITGAVIVSTPQIVALADVRRGVAMFQMEGINVPILGLIENMSYFSPAELPDNKYYIFGKGEAQKMARELTIPVLGEVPIIQSIREAGDNGRPVVLVEEKVAEIYNDAAKNMVENLIERNNNLPPTEAVRITTMAGCSTKK